MTNDREPSCLCHPPGAPQVQAVASQDQRGAQQLCVNNERARRGIGYQALSQAGLAASGINPAMHCRALFPSITRINVYGGQGFLLLHVYSHRSEEGKTALPRRDCGVE